MNCKENELAICVRSYAGNEGKVFTVLRIATREELDAAWFRYDDGPVWVIDRPVVTTDGTMRSLAVDAYIRPIRPDAEPVDTDVVAEVGA